MREKIWEYLEDTLKKDDIEAVSRQFKLPFEMAVLLLLRGVKSEESLNSYMSKSLSGIHSPFLFEDMEKACERIIASVKNKEKIVVYGDYDVDGITSTAILTDFLESIGANADFYIPDRFNEGYGLNVMAVNRLAKSGVKLIITVDCGITSVGEVSFAKTQGLDVIITDHHTCKEELPKALAVINPKRPDTAYPFPQLAGVGVAFKLILALSKTLEIPTKDTFLKYVDLAAIGTVADIVPLEGENRIIVSHGINKISKAENCGINALLEVSGCREISSSAIAFSLAPRINASGRMENASVAVNLFREKDADTAKETAEHLDSLNKLRQQTEQIIYKEALSQAEGFTEKPLVYVLKGENWHGGVIGIVASKICEKYFRPCILLSEADGKCKGSGRSIEGFNLFDALSDSDDILTVFGGHASAAGMSLPSGLVSEFSKKINLYAKNHLTSDMLTPKLYIDCRIEPSHVTLEWAKALKKFEPFGCKNEVPVFSMDNVQIVSAGAIGAQKQHLSLKLKKDGIYFNAVGFGIGDASENLSAGDYINIAFTMNINIYQDRENLQLFIKDIKKQIGTALC